MLNAIDNFYLEKTETVKSCLLALKDIILAADPQISAAWKYGMPFFCYYGKMFCYLWVDKKTKSPYLGMVEGKLLQHPQLVQEKRSRMKVLRFDAEKDLPLQTVRLILSEALALYKSGKINLR